MVTPLLIARGSAAGAALTPPPGATFAEEALADVANRLQTILQILRVAPLQTRDAKTPEFTLKSLSLQLVAQVPTLPVNRGRLLFLFFLNSGRKYRFGNAQINNSLTYEIDGTTYSQFGLTGHIGEVWAQSDAANDAVGLLEQWIPGDP